MRNLHTARYKRFIERLREARQAKGVTQQEAARALRIPQSRLSRMETGESRVDVIDIADLMRYYGRPFSFFVAPRK